MIKSILIFLGLISADSANYDHNNSNKLEININAEQLKSINDGLKDEETASVIRDAFTHLDSMVETSSKGNYKLTFHFK